MKVAFKISFFLTKLVCVCSRQHMVLINRFLIVEALEGESTRRYFQKGELEGLNIRTL